MMREMTILAVATMLSAAPASADNPPGAVGGSSHQAKPAGVTPHAPPAKPATCR